MDVATPVSIYERYEPDPKHLKDVRCLADRAAEAWDLNDDTRENLRLVADELAANAINASRDCGGTEVRVRYIYVPEAAFTEVSVWDASPAQPVVQADDPAAIDGRGLHLVEALATCWGTWPTCAADSTLPGKVVWARVSS